MSAYIVDPRSVDYLVAWITRRPASDCWTRTHDWHYDTISDVSENLRDAAVGNEQFGYYLNPAAIGRDVLGQILLAENVRSVRYRYEDCPTDELPGPCAQSRIWRYRYQSVPRGKLKAAWVIKACDNLGYQSCETDDWKQTLAYALVQAIREDAIDEITKDAPWDVSDALVAK